MIHLSSPACVSRGALYCIKKIDLGEKEGMWELYIDGGWLVPWSCVSGTLLSWIDTSIPNLGSCTITWVRWGLGSGYGLDLERIESDFPFMTTE